MSKPQNFVPFSCILSVEQKKVSCVHCPRNVSDQVHVNLKTAQLYSLTKFSKYVDLYIPSCPFLNALCH